MEGLETTFAPGFKRKERLRTFVRIFAFSTNLKVMSQFSSITIRTVPSKHYMESLWESTLYISLARIYQMEYTKIFILPDSSCLFYSQET